MSRSPIPPELRRRVAETFQHRCCYCQSQEDIAGIAFTVDHIIPEVLGGLTTFANLCYACWDCNLIKRTHIVGLDPISGVLTSLYHPIDQQWREHFTWAGRGLLVVGLTATGRATVHTIKLNRDLLLQSRRRWIEVGWHPPQS